MLGIREGQEETGELCVRPELGTGLLSVGGNDGREEPREEPPEHPPATLKSALALSLDVFSRWDIILAVRSKPQHGRLGQPAEITVTAARRLGRGSLLLFPSSPGLPRVEDCSPRHRVLWSKATGLKWLWYYGLTFREMPSLLVTLP